MCQIEEKRFIVESNPCFEVWLYLHMNDKVQGFPSDNVCKSWKRKVDESFTGGFDARRHPVFIEDAIRNSELNFKVNKIGRPLKGSSEVHLLAKSMISVLGEKIGKVRKRV